MCMDFFAILKSYRISSKRLDLLKNSLGVYDKYGMFSMTYATNSSVFDSCRISHAMTYYSCVFLPIHVFLKSFESNMLRLFFRIKGLLEIGSQRHFRWIINDKNTMILLFQHFILQHWKNRGKRMGIQLVNIYFSIHYPQPYYISIFSLSSPLHFSINWI
jgi:hypothetical protein